VPVCPASAPTAASAAAPGRRRARPPPRAPAPGRTGDSPPRTPACRRWPLRPGRRSADLGQLQPCAMPLHLGRLDLFVSTAARSTSGSDWSAARTDWSSRGERSRSSSPRPASPARSSTWGPFGIHLPPSRLVTPCPRATARARRPGTWGGSVGTANAIRRVGHPQ
jgi:hypothetical protein